MPESTKENKYIFSSFDREEKLFYLKTQNEDEAKLAITCGISLQGLSEGVPMSVNCERALTDYICCRLINPYLNAQSDVFKINVKLGETDRSVGYIFPASALEGDEEDIDYNFDEYKQAYKYYCIKHIIEQHKWDENKENQQVAFSSIIDTRHAYIIICKPLLRDANFMLTELLPNLALRGYYHFPDSTKPKVLNLLSFAGNRLELDEMIKSRFHFLGGQQSISLKKAKNILEENFLIKSLYEQLLVEADNPLYRFLILYQIIEYLVDKSFRDGLETIIHERVQYSNYKLVEKIKELENTRSQINKLFDEAVFDEKREITDILKNFIVEYNAEYEKENTGDCIYDIRNLLFHDYKSVLERNRDGAIVGLVIQCEIAIHWLVIKLGERA